MQDPDARPAGRRPVGAAIHPTEGHARGRRGATVRAYVVADVERLPRGDLEGGERHLEDARVGLGEPAAFGGDHHREEGRKPRRLESRALHAIDAVRDHAQVQSAGAELAQDRSAPRQEVAAGRERLEVGPAQPSGLAERRPHEGEQAPEALAGECGLGDPAPAVQVPEALVDASVLRENPGGAREAEAGQALAERGPLGTVEIQEGPVEVEENGAEARQGGGYFAR